MTNSSKTVAQSDLFKQNHSHLFPTSDVEGVAKMVSRSSDIALSSLIDHRHPLCRVTHQIPWTEIENRLGAFHAPTNRTLIRKITALALLKNQSHLENETLYTQWLENPYWQYFCGENRFQQIDSLSLADLNSELSAFIEAIGEHGKVFLREIADQSTLAEVNLLGMNPIDSSQFSYQAQNIKTHKRQSQLSNRQWHEDHLFYIYLLVAVGFWAVYSFIFPTQWPNSWPSYNQLKSLFYISIVYPIVEEIIFRYGIQGWFFHYKWGRISSFGISASNLLASLIFSILHIIIRPEDSFTYGIIVPSLIFGLFKDRHGHIFSCIMLHMFYNMGIFILVIWPYVK